MDYSVQSRFDQEKKCWSVAVSGEVDIFNSQDMKKSLTDLINEKNADMTVDCAGLEYMDSTALGALVAVLKNVKNYGGIMRLRNVRQNLLKLFRITNLDKAFVIEADAETEGEKNA
ncbi:MAG: STAS domain-containing protein [Firmicutes bacterium]|nr:STAS domain-containing protein [Bacillota bacterium]